MTAATLDLVLTDWRGPDVLDDLGTSHDRLVARLDVPLTSRRPWLSAWVRAYPAYEPWATCAWESDELVGACLLGLRRVGPGVEVVALGQGRNDRTRLPVLDGAVADALAERVAATMRRCPRPWSLHIEQLPVDDPFGAALAAHLPAAVLLPGGSVPGVRFGDHLAPEDHLSKNLRRQLQKSRNRITTDGLRAEIEFTRLRPTLAAHLDEIEAVHRARDHAVGRVSDIDDDAARALWRGVITAHIARDEVEIATLRLDGALSAYVISFLDHTTYRVFDGRFETQWSRYSPGRLLEVETLGRALADPRFDRLDWMNSISPEKLISANSLEPTMQLVASSPTVAPATG